MFSQALSTSYLEETGPKSQSTKMEDNTPSSALSPTGGSNTKPGIMGKHALT